VVPNYIGLAMQAGVHLLIAGKHPIQNITPRAGTFQVRYPMIPLYELEPGNTQLGSPRQGDLTNPPGDQSFSYRELCIDVIDYGFLTSQRARLTGTGANMRYCGLSGWRAPNAQSRRDDSMRTGIPIDTNFPALSLRPEAAGPGRAFAPGTQGIDVEVYNPDYFRNGQACQYVSSPRSCFEPIYGLGCLDTAERTYQQPVAFWTGAYADVVADFPGAVAARSVVFGFPPVYFNPGEVKPAIEYILFDEWQLPRRPATAASASR